MRAFRSFNPDGDEGARTHGSANANIGVMSAPRIAAVIILFVERCFFI